MYRIILPMLWLDAPTRFVIIVNSLLFVCSVKFTLNRETVARSLPEPSRVVRGLFRVSFQLSFVRSSNSRCSFWWESSRKVKIVGRLFGTDVLMLMLTMRLPLLLIKENKNVCERRKRVKCEWTDELTSDDDAMLRLSRSRKLFSVCCRGKNYSINITMLSCVLLCYVS